jgi:hypothetical protein
MLAGRERACFDASRFDKTTGQLRKMLHVHEGFACDLNGRFEAEIIRK